MAPTPKVDGLDQASISSNTAWIRGIARGLCCCDDRDVVAAVCQEAHMKEAPSLRKGSGEMSAPYALHDRYRGVLLGLAVGNTLGLPVESWPSAEIRRTYPQGMREIDPTERGLPWDDDLAQAVILADAIIEHDTFLVEELAQ